MKLGGGTLVASGSRGLGSCIMPRGEPWRRIMADEGAVQRAADGMGCAARATCVRIAVPASTHVASWTDGRDCRTDSAQATRTRGPTHKIANLRGRSRKTGVNMRPILVANKARAASNRPPNTSKRSHRLTAEGWLAGLACLAGTTWACWVGPASEREMERWRDGERECVCV